MQFEKQNNELGGPTPLHSHWRCLNNAIYSEVPAVQAISFRMLRRLIIKGEHWAKELLENAYLDPEVEEWANQAE